MLRFARRSSRLRLELVGALLLTTLAGLACAGARGASDAAMLAPPGVCRGAERENGPELEQLEAMACLVAHARAVAGVAPLRPSRLLRRAALAKLAADMRCREFSHYPCGEPLFTAFSVAGLGSRAMHMPLGENLAWGSGSRGSPSGIVRAWLASPEHRDNMLSPRWRKLGLALLRAPSFVSAPDATLWAAEFGA